MTSSYSKAAVLPRSSSPESSLPERVVAWLRSDDARARFELAADQADKAIARLNEMREVSTESLQRPIKLG